MTMPTPKSQPAEATQWRIWRTDPEKQLWYGRRSSSFLKTWDLRIPIIAGLPPAFRNLAPTGRGRAVSSRHESRIAGSPAFIHYEVSTDDGSIGASVGQSIVLHFVGYCRR